MGFWPVVKKVIKESDIILVILDARMPELFRNKELERICRYFKKKYFYVFNKIDLVSNENLSSLRKFYKDYSFVSGVNNVGMKKLKESILIYTKREKINDPLIGVVGYPNVGKSAIINALAKRAKARVSRIAGTTRGIQWINAGSLRILDSPGVVYHKDTETKIGIMGAKNPEKLKEPERVAFQLIRELLFTDKAFLEKNYGIEIEKDDDEEMILEKIGKAKYYFLKKGIVDTYRTAIKVLRDWQTGKPSQTFNKPLNS